MLERRARPGNGGACSSSMHAVQGRAAARPVCLCEAGVIECSLSLPTLPSPWPANAPVGNPSTGTSTMHSSKFAFPRTKAQP